jgi:hypothetical protein
MRNTIEPLTYIKNTVMFVTIYRRKIWRYQSSPVFSLFFCYQSPIYSLLIIFFSCVHHFIQYISSILIHPPSIILLFSHSQPYCSTLDTMLSLLKEKERSKSLPLNFNTPVRWCFSKIKIIFTHSKKFRLLTKRPGLKD